MYLGDPPAAHATARLFPFRPQFVSVKWGNECWSSHTLAAGPSPGRSQMGKSFELSGRKEFYKPRGYYYVADLGASMGSHPEDNSKFSLASRGQYGEAGWLLNWNPFGP